MIKRYLELSIIVLLMPLIALIFLTISVLILLLDGSPIIFSQSRGGHKGSVFTIYKFRTMKIQKDNESDDTNRITKLGKLLRKTSLDEIPSIYNVIKGDMSIVGPRPLIAEYLDLYSDLQKKRHDVKPGLTGLAQIKGRNLVDWEERLEYDVFYVENQSFFLDFIILIKSFGITFKRKGITPKGSEIMPEFDPSSK